MEASIRQGVQRHRSGPGGGKGASSIRGPHRWRQVSGQVYRDVGVDREVGRGKLYTRTTQVEASIRPGVQRRRSGPRGGKGASAIRGPYRWRQASVQVYRDEEWTERWEGGKLYTRTTQVEASIRPGVPRRRGGPGGGKGESSIRGPYK